MRVYKEVKEIAKTVSKIHDLTTVLIIKGLEVDGIDWYTAEFVKLSKEKVNRFKEHNGETENYFVDQRTGYCEDCFYGHLYFKTDIQDVYIKVYFSC